MINISDITVFVLLAFSNVIFLVGATTLTYYRKTKIRNRTKFIDNYQFPPEVISQFREVRPNLSKWEVDLVFAALRDYFHLCNRAEKKMVSMPSQVVDDAWHAFILNTHDYRQYCRFAFSRFLHHTPVEAISSPTLAGKGLRRAWRLACDYHSIDPKSPSRLPLLFSIDADLGLENSFFSVPDSSTLKSESMTFGVDLHASDFARFFVSEEDSGADDGGDGDGGGCGGD